jgi:hypothetical protein
MRHVCPRPRRSTSRQDNLTPRDIGFSGGSGAPGLNQRLADQRLKDAHTVGRPVELVKKGRRTRCRWAGGLRAGLRTGRVIRRSLILRGGR